MNKFLYYSNTLDFTPGDTTPDISFGYIFKVPAAVTIVDFDGALDRYAKLIEIIADADDVIIVHNNNRIKLHGGIDVLLNTGDSIMLRYMGDVWTERLRSLL